jgi:hypothetical protein
MKAVGELVKSLSFVFKWDKRHLNCLGQTILALFAVRTVNRQELAVSMKGQSKIESKYKRIYRFFAFFAVDLSIIAAWIFKLFFCHEQKVYLTLDRTNWEFGKQPINVLMLGIAYEGMSIPILWTLLPKKGSSNTKERITIIKRFIDLFGKDCIEGLLCDREFVGEGWFEYLIKQQIPFYIRIKNNTLIRAGKKKLWEAKKIFRQVNPKTSQTFGMSVEIGKNKVYLAGSRSEKGELMIVATNMRLKAKNAINTYLRRWEIDCLFSGLKSRGFRFEDTHMTQSERIEKLIALLAIGFSWAHKVGEFKASLKPIALKKHKDGQRRLQNSYFRYGFDFLREAILDPEHKTQSLIKYMKILFQTPEKQSGGAYV